MRLIDADALKKAVENLCVGGEEQIKHNRSDGIYWLDGICDAYREINNAPTVKRKPFATVTFDKDELNRIVDERVIEPIKNGELVIKEERPQGEPVIKCKDCKYQVKEWRVNRRMKEKGYWAYGCKHFGEIMGYWGFGGDDNEFCSDAEIKEAENDNP